IAQARPLGDDGYETLVIALLLMTLLPPSAGTQSETAATLEELIALCEERGDRLHLASALCNRRVLAIARHDVDQIVADGLRCLAISRELGLSELEYVIEYNLAEALYLADDLTQATPHLERALELERRHPPDQTRPYAGLLELRLEAYRGA